MLRFARHRNSPRLPSSRRGGRGPVRKGRGGRLQSAAMTPVIYSMNQTARTSTIIATIIALAAVVILAWPLGVSRPRHLSFGLDEVYIVRSWNWRAEIASEFRGSDSSYLTSDLLLNCDVIVRCGVPWHVAEYSFSCTSWSVLYSRTTIVYSSPLVPDDGVVIRIYWGRLLLLYACVYLSAHFVVVSLRRACAAFAGVARKRRGHCVFCGYDVSASLATCCPECGRASGTTSSPDTDHRFTARVV
jgi:hypothetical protein